MVSIISNAQTQESSSSSCLSLLQPVICFTQPNSHSFANLEREQDGDEIKDEASLFQAPFPSSSWALSVVERSSEREEAWSNREAQRSRTTALGHEQAGRHTVSCTSLVYATDARCRRRSFLSPRPLPFLLSSATHCPSRCFCQLLWSTGTSHMTCFR